RAVLAPLRHVSGEIGRAGLEDLDAVGGRVTLAVAAQRRGLRRRAEQRPILRIVTALQVAGTGRELRHLDELVAVEVEMREDRVLPAGVALVVASEEDVRLAGNARDVRGIDEALGA